MRSPFSSSRGLALVACVVAAMPAHAEVAAEIDAFGSYVRTVVVANGSTRNLKVWTPSKSRTPRVILNPDGDLYGDLYPAILESPIDRVPLVVWSHAGTADFDLVWSQFRDGAWGPTAPLAAEASPGADLDPAIAFDGPGRPHLAWWRDESGIGVVYYTMFLTTRWMLALPVSDPGVDSRYPSITALPDGRIRITYVTPFGNESRIIAKTTGATITDDINPFKSLSISEEPQAPALTQ
jgi:hypothetical protein